MEFGKYEGQRNNKNQTHGTGNMIWTTNGDTYEGQWHNGEPHGVGTFTNAVQNYTYVGEWNFGKRHGIGTLKLSNGDVFSGTFYNNSLEGVGVAFYHNGDYYEGDFRQGIKEGQGTMRYKSGEVYEGTWWNDLKEGKGKLTQPDGNQFLEGHWKAGTFTGRGKARAFAESSSVYMNMEGRFREGKLYGEGVYHDSLGNHYEGEFKEGGFHGKGKLSMANGHRYTGRFEFNDFRKGKWESPQQVTVGRFYKYKPDGSQIEVSYANGDTFNGRMKEGSMSGFGQFKHNERDLVYIGNFDHNKRHGEGTFVFPDGAEYSKNYHFNQELD